MNNCDKQECSQCGGEGGFDDGPHCTGRCDWCGGCYDQIQCERCEGSGEVDAECATCGDEVVNGCCVSSDEHGEEEAA